MTKPPPAGPSRSVVLKGYNLAYPGTHLTLDRFLHVSTGTLGILLVHGLDGEQTRALAFTLEPSIAEPHPCIPAGRYRLHWHPGGPHGELYRHRGYPGVLALDVPDRTNIEIHAGNTARDTAGCIILGFNVDNVARQPVTVLRSRQAVEHTYMVLQPLLEGGSVYLHVV